MYFLANLKANQARIRESIGYMTWDCPGINFVELPSNPCGCVWGEGVGVRITEKSAPTLQSGVPIRNSDIFMHGVRGVCVCSRFWGLGRVYKLLS